MSLPNMCTPFDPAQESITEFFQRFQCQLAELLEKCRNNDDRRAKLLIKVLPVSVITDLQRRLAPDTLTEATYDMLHDHLIEQFQSSRSTVGASVSFLTCKQLSGQSLEDYARKLNSLASLCNYPSNCLDRLLRDSFVAGLASSAMLTSLIQVCDALSFRETVERAKLLETFHQDAHSIHSQRSQIHATSDSLVEDVNKLSDHDTKNPKATYICYRCGTKGQHFSDKCAARSLTCNICHKVGHIARICQRNKRQMQGPHQRPAEARSFKQATCNYTQDSACCSPHTSTHTGGPMAGTSCCAHSRPAHTTSNTAHGYHAHAKPHPAQLSSTSYSDKHNLIVTNNDSFLE